MGMKPRVKLNPSQKSGWLRRDADTNKYYTSNWSTNWTKDIRKAHVFHSRALAAGHALMNNRNLVAVKIMITTKEC